jgi:hypothetical protein
MKIKIICLLAAILISPSDIGSIYLSHWLIKKLFHDKNHIYVQP